MADGLSIAGTVEMNAIEAPFNTNRTEYLGRKSHEMFGDIGPPDATWLGYRPTLPDALHIIGYYPQSRRIIFAFGHQHIGRTLGGVSGRIVTDLVQGRTSFCDIDNFLYQRF